MALGSAADYVALCVVQGALVAVPFEARRSGRRSVVGLAIPVAMLAIGVVLLRAFSGAADALAGLGWVATPVLAGCAGAVLRPLRLGRTAPLALLLYVVAWRLPGTGGEVASIGLIAMAVLALAAVVRGLAPAPAIQVGLVILCVVDTILVWGTPQVGPAGDALAAAHPPVLLGRAFPALQQVTLGSMQMGWLDLLAPALLALTLRRSERPVAAVATAAAAAVWGLLLLVTSPIPATPPILAGLAAALLVGKRTGGSRARGGGRDEAQVRPKGQAVRANLRRTMEALAQLTRPVGKEMS